jgi:hypothetical protein
MVHKRGIPVYHYNPFNPNSDKICCRTYSGRSRRIAPTSFGGIGRMGFIYINTGRIVTKGELQFAPTVFYSVKTVNPQVPGPRS